MGKDTVAECIADVYGYYHYGFAYPIKFGFWSMFGVDPFTMSREDKEKPADYLCGKSPREAMQWLGMEFGRDMMGDNLWLMRAKVIWDGVQGKQPYAGLVISDVRCGNESEWIRSEGGQIWHVLRDVPAVAPHRTEYGIKVKRKDIVIHNDEDIDALHRQVQKIMESANQKPETLSYMGLPKPTKEVV